MARRSRTEVIIDILSEALKCVNKTRIMYRANLNFLRFNRYFGELVELGLVELVDNPDESGLVYRTTDKGLVLLEMLKKARQIISL